MNEEFNPKIYEDYKNNRDYDGLYNYLSTFTPKDLQSYRKHQAYLDDIKKQADIQRAILEQLQDDPKTRDAYHFTQAMNGNGVIPHKDINNPNDKGNFWGDSYNALVNDLKVISDHHIANKGDAISSIMFEFSNEDEYDTFLNKSGLGEQKDETLTVNVDHNTGKYNITVPRSNIRLTTYFNAAKQSFKKSYKNIAPYYVTSAEAYVINAIPNNPNYIVMSRISGITDKGVVVPGNSFNYSNLDKLNTLKEQAANIQQKAIDGTMSYSGEEELVVTEFMGIDHAKMRQSYQAGIIDESRYNSWVNARKKSYDNQLRLVSLAKYKVYASDDDSKSAIVKPVDSTKAYELNQELLVAIDQNRVAYAAAMVGGELGTYITISPKVDSHNNIEKGEYAKSRRMFIPGLFKNTCDESFKQNTKQRAVVDNQQLKRFNYGTRLADGSFVGYDKRYGAYKKVIDDQGNEIKVSIDEQEMLQSLNKHHILNQAYRAAAEYVLYESVPDVKVVNNKKISVTVEDKILNVVKHGVNELYPKDRYTNGKRLIAVQELYNNIINRLNATVFKSETQRTNTN